MRMIFGVLSLLFVVAIVGVLVKKQLSGPVLAPAIVVPGAAAIPGAATPQQQSQQAQQQYKQAIESAMQPRPTAEDARPDDAK